MRSGQGKGRQSERAFLHLSRLMRGPWLMCSIVGWAAGTAYAIRMRVNKTQMIEDRPSGRRSWRDERQMTGRTGADEEVSQTRGMAAERMNSSDNNRKMMHCGELR